MLPSCFDYIFVNSRQKARLRPELSPKFLSTLGPNPTRKARPDLQLWSVIRLSNISFFTRLHNLTHVSKALTVSSSLPSLSTSCLRTNLGPRLLISILKYFCVTKVPLFENLWWRYIARDFQLRPHLYKILATPLPEFKKLCLIIFLFNHSKNNAVLTPRTKTYIWRLEGLEA